MTLLGAYGSDISLTDAYRTIHQADCRIANDQGAATIMFCTGAGVASGGNIAQPERLPTVYIDDADWAVGALTLRLRTRAQLLTNATDAGSGNFVVGLYPVTVAGGTDLITPTLGTVVSSSTATFSNPAASTAHSAVSSDFAFPADGTYAFGVVLNATTGNNAAVQISAQLQVRAI